MAETDLPYISREKNRHGTPVVFVRRHGRRIRIKSKEGSSDLRGSTRKP